jgi:hypothetical protein
MSFIYDKTSIGGSHTRYVIFREVLRDLVYNYVCLLIFNAAIMRLLTSQMTETLAGVFGRDSQFQNLLF